MKLFYYVFWKIYQVFKPLPTNRPHYFRIDRAQKTLVLNDVEYELIEEVWDFLLQITTEREFYKDKYEELSEDHPVRLYS